nr:p22 [Chrysanthemum kita-like virus]
MKSKAKDSRVSMRRPKLLNNLRLYKPIVKSTIKTRVREAGLEECFEDILSSIRRLIDAPTTLMMVLGIVVICLTHTDDLSEGFLKTLVDGHPDNRFLKFLEDHFKQALGMSIFSAVIVDLPRSTNKLLALIGAAVWVFALPPYNIYQYGSHALIAHSYFRVSRRKSKVILLAIAMIIFLFGHTYLGTMKHPLTKG